MSAPAVPPSGLAGGGLIDRLRDLGVSVEVRSHRPAYTARDAARHAHLRAGMVAKAVVVRAGESLAMLVVSAASHVDVERAARILGAASAQLVHEEELVADLGWWQPCMVSPLAAGGMPVVVDAALAAEDRIAVAGGSPDRTLILGYDDFARLVPHTVGDIAAAPARRVRRRLPTHAAAEPSRQALASTPGALACAAMSVAEAVEALASSPAGLDGAEADRRAATFGANVLAEARGPSLLRRLGAQFVNLFALLLWAGSALAVAAGEPVLAVAIVAVIVVNGLFGLWQEHRAQRAVAELRKLLPETVTALRGGREQPLPVDRLVPGDVVLLQEGDRVPADARVLEAGELRVDESALTGESHPVHKVAHAARADVPLPQAHDMVFAGTVVTAGTGRCLVVATGMRTLFGDIARLTQAVHEERSPLQREVDRVARRVAAISVVMGVAFFAIGFGFAGLTLRDGAVFAVGIVLANVPEGLLPTMTLSLAMCVQRMARRRAVVKRLSSAETLGCCTVICTDKTGTLTENRMTVRSLWVADGTWATVGGGALEVRGELRDQQGRVMDGAARDRFIPALRAGHLCNAARLLPPDGGDEWRIAGDATEAALLVAAAKAGLRRDEDLRTHPLVRQLAFDAHRKRMSTVHRGAPRETGMVAYVKGAPRELLEHCVRALRGAEEVDLDDALRRNVVEAIDSMASQGLRVLGMAYRYVPPDDGAGLPGMAPGDVERDLVFAGLAGMHDAARQEVPGAVAACRRAGIRVVMVTGDDAVTAAAIAAQVGIVEDATAPVISSAELEAMPEAELEARLAAAVAIFARSTPEQKLRIVAALQRQGHVVAVTGDGVNDAPALKKADIGVAMGRTGTDVAREAADMVLLDDNFATIVSAVEEGRAIFDNMRKFIVYVFAHLSPEAIPFVLFALGATPLPLTVMQILAIDLGTETLPALALGVERPEPDVMTRPPRARTTRLLDWGALGRGYGFLGGMTASAVIAVFLLYLSRSGWAWGHRDVGSAVGAGATTVVFGGIVLMQVGNAFACRTERASALRIPLGSNRFLLWGIGFELVLAAMIVYLPGLQDIFGTTAVAPAWWLLLAALVPPVFLAEEARKRLRRRQAARRAAES